MNTHIISINDVIVNVSDGLGINEKLDERLDGGLLFIPYSSQSTEYGMLDIVKIVFKNSSNVIIKTMTYRVNGDSVDIVSYNPVLYSHLINLSERTIKWNKYLGGSFSFSNEITNGVQVSKYTMEDVIDVISDMLPFRLASELESGRVLNMSTSLRSYLSTINAPELYIDAPTIREACNQALKYVNAISREDNDGNLDADFYNNLNNLITFEKSIDRKSNQTSELYATSLESSINNLVNQSNPNEAAVTYPGPSQGIGVRAETAILTSDNGIGILPFNMYKPLTFEVLADGNADDFLGITNLLDVFEWVDMNDHLLEKSLYDALPVDSDATGYDDTTGYKIWDKELCQQNTFYYEYNKNKIEGMFNTFGVYSTKQSIINFMRIALYRVWVKYNPTLDPDTYLTNLTLRDSSYQGDYDSLFESFQFRIKYIPNMDSAKMRSQRLDLSVINKYSQIRVNQRNRLISLQEFSNNMKGQIQRMGVNYIQQTKLHALITDLHEIGDYTYISGKLYIISEREIQIYNDYYKVIYRYDNNFNRLSEFIGVNSQIRQSDITSDERNIISHQIYEEYCIIEPSSTIRTGNTNSLLLEDLAYVNILNTIVPTTTFKSANVGLVSTPTLGVIPFTAVGGVNNLQFNWFFNEVAKVSDYLNFKTSSSTLNIQSPFLHTEDDGTYLNNYLTLSVYDDLYEEPLINYDDDPTGYETTFTNVTKASRILPEMLNSPTDKLIGGVFNFNKDAAQIPRVTYQINFMPKDLEILVIGKFFTEKNQLVSSLQVNDLYVYVSNETYNQNDTISTKGTKVVGATILNYPSSNVISVSGSDITGYQSWALGDDDGNLYLGINQGDDLLPYITFDFENKHPDMNYTW